MSNATTLQTNNNKLSANNTDLASILNTINNLPEAGGGSGGGGIQTVTITIIDMSSYGDYWSNVEMFYTTYENGEIVLKKEALDDFISERKVIVGSVVGLIDNLNAPYFSATSSDSDWNEQSSGIKIGNIVTLPILENTSSISFII